MPTHLHTMYTMLTQHLHTTHSKPAQHLYTTYIYIYTKTTQHLHTTHTKPTLTHLIYYTNNILYITFTIQTQHFIQN